MNTMEVGPAPLSALLQQRLATLRQVRALADEGKLYAVLDACDTPIVPRKALEVGRRRAVSLYRGGAEEMYWAIAPYLFVVDGELLDWIVSELWPEPWGIFAVSDEDLDAVRRHFRRFLLVQAPNGEQWYFRFYDPRVLHPFLCAATAPELTSFFGALEALGVRDTHGPTVRLFSRARGRRIVVSQKLTRAASDRAGHS
jgi:hypothetical protein